MQLFELEVDGVCDDRLYNLDKHKRSHSILTR